MWGREMRAGLIFVLVSLCAGAALREWRRSHQNRFRAFVASLESPGEERGSPPVPRSEGPSDSESTERASGLRRAHRRRDREPLRPARIDPDRAEAADWERLPGIGPALARRILADREAKGPFRGPEGLLRVPGIGPRTLERIRPYLTSGPAGVDSQAAN